jgi:hypothetical protein
MCLQSDGEAGLGFGEDQVNYFLWVQVEPKAGKTQEALGPWCDGKHQ